MSSNMTSVSSVETQQYKYYPILGMTFVTFLLTANVVGPKPISFSFVAVPAGLIIFPLTYLVGGVLTEVYGYASSRKIIWTGLASNLFLAVICKLAIAMPYDDAWSGQAAYQQVLGLSSWLMFVSVFTYFVGEFVNSFIVAKLKLYMNGKRFWVRGLCGSWIGEAVETTLFLPLAFYHLPVETILRMAVFYYVFKLLYSIAAVPLQQRLASFLKQKEGIDHYDYNTSFNPLYVFT